MFCDPDVDGQAAGIAGVEEMGYADGRWTATRELNGDQSDQGRALLMDAHAFRVYRVRLYAYPRGQAKPQGGGGPRPVPVVGSVALDGGGQRQHESDDSSDHAGGGEDRQDVDLGNQPDSGR